MANASHTPTLIMIMNITKSYLEKHKYLNYSFVNLTYEHITCAQYLINFASDKNSFLYWSENWSIGTDKFDRSD